MHQIADSVKAGRLELNLTQSALAIRSDMYCYVIEGLKQHEMSL